MPKGGSSNKIQIGALLSSEKTTLKLICLLNSWALKSPEQQILYNHHNIFTLRVIQLHVRYVSLLRVNSNSHKPECSTHYMNSSVSRVNSRMLSLATLRTACWQPLLLKTLIEIKFKKKNPQLHAHMNQCAKHKCSHLKE